MSMDSKLIYIQIWILIGAESEWNLMKTYFGFNWSLLKNGFYWISPHSLRGWSCLDVPSSGTRSVLFRRANILDALILC